MLQYNSGHRLSSATDSVAVSGAVVDIFGNPVGVERRNWMEVPFDSSTFSSYMTETHSGTASRLLFPTSLCNSFINDAFRLSLSIF